MSTDYRAKLQAILGRGFTGDRVLISYNWDTVEEAKRVLAEIRQKQKELRLLKKEIGATMKDVRSTYRMQKSEVQAGFLAAFAGRKSAGQDRARRRENLKRQEEIALSVHQTHTEIIDQVLVQMDRVKLDIDKWFMEQKSK